MRFDYTNTPQIKITIRNNKVTYDTYALVDSGADYCSFPTYVGTRIGLDVKSVPPGKMKGIAGKVDAWYHDIQIVLRRNIIDVKAAFIDDLPAAILGRNGFFETYKVIICHSERYLELKNINK